MGSIVTKIRNEGASHPLHPIVRHDMVDSAIPTGLHGLHRGGGFYRWSYSSQPNRLEKFTIP